MTHAFLHIRQRMPQFGPERLVVGRGWSWLIVVCWLVGWCGWLAMVGWRWLVGVGLCVLAWLVDGREAAPSKMREG